MKKIFPCRTVLALLPVLAFGLAQRVSAQSSPVTDYADLVNDLNSGITNITNFQNPTTINLLASGFPTIQITNNVIIDAGTNGVLFQGNGTNGGTRIFNVFPNAMLTLNNLILTGGIATNGGAIYNAGTLIVSNCLFAGNTATNTTGTNGANGPLGGQGNGANGGSGAGAAGGAIYSTGPLIVSFSLLTNNYAEAGNGGNGGNATGGLANGGSAGSGGNAFGGAIFSSGSNNVFYETEFSSNFCIAGIGGSGGTYATNTIPFEGSGGAAGLGGSCAGGAAFVAGPLYMTNCVFAGNVAAAGGTGAAEADSNGGGAEGSPGGSAFGACLFITNGVASADVENSIFYFNACYGGAGGSTALNAAVGGTGGGAWGGAVWSGAALARMDFCTLADNFVIGGRGGTNSAGGFFGTAGTTNGQDIFRSAGVFDLSGSILSGDGNSSPPNAVGVIDAGYNISSDASLTRSASVTTSKLTFALKPRKAPMRSTTATPRLRLRVMTTPRSLPCRPTRPGLQPADSSRTPLSRPVPMSAHLLRGTCFYCGAALLAVIALLGVIALRSAQRGPKTQA